MATTILSLKVYLPIRRRINHVDLPVNHGFKSTGDVISNDIMMSPTNESSLILSDYKPGRYREIYFRPFKELMVQGTEVILSAFQSNLKKVLESDIKDLDLLAHIDLEAQVQQLLVLLATYDHKKIIRRYREDARRKAMNFYPAMTKFIKAKSLPSKEKGIKIEFGDKEDGSVELPAPIGNQHLLAAMSDFFLNYYTKHQPTKNILPLTEDLIVENCEKIKNGTIKLDKSLIDNFHVDFYFNILYIIRNFPQFKRSQRKAEFTLTEMEKNFIVAFLHLIDYELWRKNKYKYISPKPMPKIDKKFKSLASSLHYQMKKHWKSCTNSGDYTT